MGKRSNTGAVAAGAAVAAGGAIAAGKVVHDVVSDRAQRKRARRFRLDPEETARDAIVRVAHGQLDLAIALVEGREGKGPEAIHEARKALKRQRAVLRLCRPWLGTECFRQENTILRDAGRSLSGLRDAQVLIETLAGIREPLEEQLPEGTWSRFREELLADARAHEDGAEGPDAHANVAIALLGVRERVDVWSLPEGDGLNALADGLERVYTKARRAHRRAADSPTPENLHELRKRTKDVWHAGQLLAPLSPKRVGKLRRRAHRLADVLGEHHDLTVLRERADSAPEAFAPGEQKLLVAAVERRQQALESKGLARAAKLYRRKPRKLVRRAVKA